jgi:secreted Zn-dependent insulinase-like peptidase
MIAFDFSAQWVLLTAICCAYIIIILTVAILMQFEVTGIMLIFVRAYTFSFKCLLKVSLGGYNDKMRALLNAILVQIASFEVKPNRFSALKVILWIFLLSVLFPFIIFLSRI